MISEEMLEIGCSCHTMPPCSFCMELDEEEASIFWNEGYQALYKHVMNKQKDGNNNLQM